MEITDEQIRDACNRLGLTPVGRPEVRGYNTGLNLDEADDWESDTCFSLAYSVVSGTNYPDAGPLGLAVGHESPGWRYLRGLVDEIAGRLGDGRFDGYDYAESKDVMDTVAAHRARNWPWTDALVAVADLEVDEEFEDAKTWLGNETPGLAEQAWILLGYAGYQVCQEVFADFLSAKNQEA